MGIERTDLIPIYGSEFRGRFEGSLSRRWMQIACAATAQGHSVFVSAIFYDEQGTVILNQPHRELIGSWHSRLENDHYLEIPKYFWRGRKFSMPIPQRAHSAVFRVFSYHTDFSVNSVQVEGLLDIQSSPIQAENARFARVPTIAGNYLLPSEAPSSSGRLIFIASEGAGAWMPGLMGSFQELVHLQVQCEADFGLMLKSAKRVISRRLKETDEFLQLSVKPLLEQDGSSSLADMINELEIQDDDKVLIFGTSEQCVQIRAYLEDAPTGAVVLGSNDLDIVRNNAGWASFDNLCVESQKLANKFSALGMECRVIEREKVAPFGGGGFLTTLLFRIRILKRRLLREDELERFQRDERKVDFIKNVERRKRILEFCDQLAHSERSVSASLPVHLPAHDLLLVLTYGQADLNTVKNSMQPILSSAMQGYDATVFFISARSGSGATEAPGTLYAAAEYCFAPEDSSSREKLLWVPTDLLLDEVARLKPKNIAILGLDNAVDFTAFIDALSKFSRRELSFLNLEHEFSPAGLLSGETNIAERNALTGRITDWFQSKEHAFDIEIRE